MINVIRQIVLVPMFCVAFVAPNANAADFIVDGISELQGQVGNWVFFRPSDPWVTQGCSAGGWIGLDISTEGGQAAYSNLLLAFANDYSFKVRLLPGSCTNNGTYDSTTMIRLIK